MFSLHLDADEFYDDDAMRFVTTEPIDIQLEHSLESLSRWESKWHKPFLSGEHSVTEMNDYVRCMIVGDCPNDLFSRLSADDYEAISDYIGDPMTATKFYTLGEKQESSGKSETITAELIYYWMITNEIPFSCESWHLNRLLALIRVCNLKNNPGKKMSGAELARRNRELNEARLRKYGTRG